MTFLYSMAIRFIILLKFNKQFKTYGYTFLYTDNVNNDNLFS